MGSTFLHVCIAYEILTVAGWQRYLGIPSTNLITSFNWIPTTGGGWLKSNPRSGRCENLEKENMNHVNNHVFTDGTYVRTIPIYSNPGNAPQASSSHLRPMRHDMTWPCPAIPSRHPTGPLTWLPVGPPAMTSRRCADMSWDHFFDLNPKKEWKNIGKWPPLQLDFRFLCVSICVYLLLRVQQPKIKKKHEKAGFFWMVDGPNSHASNASVTSSTSSFKAAACACGNHPERVWRGNGHLHKSLKVNGIPPLANGKASVETFPNHLKRNITSVHKWFDKNYMWAWVKNHNNLWSFNKISHLWKITMLKS